MDFIVLRSSTSPLQPPSGAPRGVFLLTPLRSLGNELWEVRLGQQILTAKLPGPVAAGESFRVMFHSKSSGEFFFKRLTQAPAQDLNTQVSYLNVVLARSHLSASPSNLKRLQKLVKSTEPSPQKAELAGEWLHKGLPPDPDLLNKLLSWFEPPRHQDADEVLDLFNESKGPGGQWVLLPLQFQRGGRTLEGMARFLLSDIPPHPLITWGFKVELEAGPMDFIISKNLSAQTLIITTPSVLPRQEEITEQLIQNLSRGHEWKVQWRFSSELEIFPRGGDTSPRRTDVHA